MVFEKGNQLAVGNKGGVEKKYDREEYAQKLLEWVEKPSSLNIIGFCAANRIPGEYIARWSKESDVFRQAVDIARAVIADRQDLMVQTGRMDLKTTARMAGYYNSVLNSYERGELEFEYGLKKGLEEPKDLPTKIEVVDYRRAAND